MSAAVIPENEKERQASLDQYHILDTLPEQAYDDITRIAAMICGTPAATITFIDSDRQQFKSKIGMLSDGGSRDHSFCAHAINTPGDIMEIPDARKDDAFRDNPLVTGDPYIVFYAGMPIVTEAGMALGTLCVIDHQPRTLNDQQRMSLKSLSSQVMRLLDLRKRNLELAASQVKLTAYAEQMKDFAYIASHDMKEPLRMVTAFTHILEKDYASQLDERGGKYIRMANDGAKRLTALIDDLLVYAGTSANSQPAEKINMTRLMEEVQALMKNVLEEKNAVVQYANLPAVNGYRTAIKALFQNLVSNALKYQHEDSRPLIMIRGVELDDCWQYCVDDNGIGIDETQSGGIFEAFTRLDKDSRFGGTGLGLAICKNITARHGGHVRVESKTEGGSRFYVTFCKQIPIGNA
jgi:signal transduction histidine kinase